MLTHYRYKIFTVAFGLFAAAFTLQSCHHKEQEEEKQAKFQVTDTLINSLLIDTVKEAGAVSQITLTGSIAPDENKMVKIFPMVSGVVQDVHVQLGDVVQKGQTLAILKSPEIAAFNKDVVSSAADVRSLKRTYESTNDLYKSGLASQKDLESAQADYQKAQAEAARASAVVSINKSNGQGYELRTPISGYVVERNVTNSMQVRADNSTNLFTIADLSTVYVLINVYESDISSVKVGDPVKITTLSYPDKVFDGHIDRIDNMLDPDNKVMHARVKIENPGNLLKPQMFANVVITGRQGSAGELPVINTRALVFDNNKNYVLVVDGKAHIRIQEVQIAKTVEDRAYISSGVKPGDKLVGSRQVYLYESLKD